MGVRFAMVVCNKGSSHQSFGQMGPSLLLWCARLNPQIAVMQ